MVGVTRGAYYNENDPKAAAWLRELIKRGLIAPGEVDERSISDVSPDDLVGFTQHHFFTGIGGWSKALRLAGWPDDRPVWTGSCPCQPFSTAGKGGGFADERHLWPHWEWLIGQHHPATVFGEQVASKDGLEWFDLVSADLEGQGYAVAASDMCAAGFGAPHIRQRLWWVGLADADRSVTGQWRGTGGAAIEGLQRGTVTNGRGVSGCVADADDTGSQGWVGMPQRATERSVGSGGLVVGMEHGAGYGWQQWRAEPGWRGVIGGCGDGGTNAPDSPWRNADWLYCRDGKWRPVEPGTFPLAHGVSDRVVRLRGYGNAIVPQVAAEWIRAVMEV